MRTKQEYAAQLAEASRLFARKGDRESCYTVVSHKGEGKVIINTISLYLACETFEVVETTIALAGLGLSVEAKTGAEISETPAPRTTEAQRAADNDAGEAEALRAEAAQR